MYMCNGPHTSSTNGACVCTVGRVMGRAPPAARGTGRCSGCGFPGSEGCSCFFSLSMVQFELINNTSRPMEKLPEEALIRWDDSCSRTPVKNTSMVGEEQGQARNNRPTSRGSVAGDTRFPGMAAIVHPRRKGEKLPRLALRGR